AWVRGGADVALSQKPRVARGTERVERTEPGGEEDESELVVPQRHRKAPSYPIPIVQLDILRADLQLAFGLRIGLDGHFDYHVPSPFTSVSIPAVLRKSTLYAWPSSNRNPCLLLSVALWPRRRWPRSLRLPRGPQGGQISNRLVRL